MVNVKVTAQQDPSGYALWATLTYRQRRFIVRGGAAFGLYLTEWGIGSSSMQSFGTGFTGWWSAQSWLCGRRGWQPCRAGTRKACGNTPAFLNRISKRGNT